MRKRREDTIREMIVAGKERRYSEEITIDEQKIKEMLVAIREPRCPFEISIIRELSIECGGSYYRGIEKMELYLLNHNSNNEIIHTAIHEYAHHFMRRGVRHKAEFWDCFYQLLEIADKKGLYSCDIEKSDKLKKITAIIKKNDLLRNERTFEKELGKEIDFVFIIINKLCDEIGINYEYYLAKYLGIYMYEIYRPKERYSFYLYLYPLICNGEIRKSTPYKKYINSLSEIDDFLEKFFDYYSTS